MHPTKQLEIQEIYRLWKEVFSFDDGGSIDDFFQRNFKKEHCYIWKEKNKIVATLYANPHLFYINNHYIPILFISGVITHPSYRKQGYMRKLLQQVFWANKNQYALCALQAYNPKLYTSFGFIPTHFQKNETIDYTNRSNSVSICMNPQLLYQCWLKFSSTQNGYLIRSLSWYQNYVREVKAQNMKIVAIIKKNHCLAYATLCKDKGYTIEEIIYISQNYKHNLLSYLRKHYQIFRYPSHQGCESINLFLKILNLDLLNQQTDIFHPDEKSFFQKHTFTFHYGYW